MAGRGKDAVIPAWMREGGGAGYAPGASTVPPPVPDRPVEREERDKDRRVGGDERAPRRRSRSPEVKARRRSPSRERSRTPPRRREKKKSNFDIGPTGEFTPAVPMPIITGGSSDVRFAPPPMAMMSVTAEGGPVQSVAMQATRHARRIYVGGIGDVGEKEIEVFFNDVLTRALHRAPPNGGTYVINVYINQERRFAFVEFGSIALTSACMSLDGVLFRGQPLKIKRPNDYNAAMVPPSSEVVPTLDMSALGVVSTTVADGPNKVFVGGLPYDLTADHVKELLSAFGPLKAFHLVKDAGATVSKGYGFCEWADPSVTEKACEGLNNMNVCGKTLTVRRAVAQSEAKAGAVGLAGFGGIPGFDMGSVGAMLGGGGPVQLASIPPLPIVSPFVPAPTPALKPPTRVLVLCNMVTSEELQDDEEFEDIVADVREECSKFGVVKSVVIPRAGPGVSKVFVEYATVEQCVAAANTLHGRQFAARKVTADYMPEEDFAAKNFSGV